MDKARVTWCSIGFNRMLTEEENREVLENVLSGIDIPARFHPLCIHKEDNTKDEWARKNPGSPVTLHIPEEEYTMETIETFCTNLVAFCIEHDLKMRGTMDMDSSAMTFSYSFDGIRRIVGISDDEEDVADAVATIMENLDKISGEDIDDLFLALVAEARRRECGSYNAVNKTVEEEK